MLCVILDIAMFDAHVELILVHLLSCVANSLHLVTNLTDILPNLSVCRRNLINLIICMVIGSCCALISSHLMMRNFLCKHIIAMILLLNALAVHFKCVTARHQLACWLLNARLEHLDFEVFLSLVLRLLVL